MTWLTGSRRPWACQFRHVRPSRPGYPTTIGASAFMAGAVPFGGFMAWLRQRSAVARL